MGHDVATLIGKISELHGRALEISNRMRQDSAQLTEVHIELSRVLGNLWSLDRDPEPVPIASNGPQVLRIAEVSKRIGLGRSTVWQMVKDGAFPSPLRLSERAVGWRANQLDEWLQRRSAAGPAKVPTDSIHKRSRRRPSG